MTNNRNLNLNRLKYSKILLIIAVVVAVYYNQNFMLFTKYEFIAHIIGFLFIIVCVLGRIYSTAFLGGYKANTIISHGPFSVVRNPLYIFSFFGVLGLSVMSNNYLIIAIAPISFILIYYPVVLREESFLKQHFGKEYIDYCQKVNRFIPNFKLYNGKEQIVCSYKPFESAFLDSSIWIVGAIVFYTISMVHF
jgi:protein-S-isoprenylcysteine O-methyltransferase Ste14